MEIQNPLVDRLTAELAAIDQERMAIKEKGRRKRAELDAVLFAVRARKWGLTPEQYTEAIAPIGIRRQAEGAYHAGLVQIAKMKDKIGDNRFSKEQRAGFEKRLAELEAGMAALEAAVQTVNYEPLSVHLNRARMLAGLGVKVVQSTTATVVKK